MYSGNRSQVVYKVFFNREGNGAGSGKGVGGGGGGGKEPSKSSLLNRELDPKSNLCNYYKTQMQQKKFDVIF